MAEGRFRFPKTIEEEELCVKRAVPRSTSQCKNGFQETSLRGDVSHTTSTSSSLDQPTRSILSSYVFGWDPDPKTTSKKSTEEPTFVAIPVKMATENDKTNQTSATIQEFLTIESFDKFLKSKKCLKKIHQAQCTTKVTKHQ